MLGAVPGLRTPATAAVPHPVRVVAFHGTNDLHQSLWGRRDGPMGRGRKDAAIDWARSNGVVAEPEEDHVSATLSHVSFGPDEAPAR